MSTKIEHILKTQEEYVCSKKQILVDFGDSKKCRDFTLILRLTWELLCLVERLAFHSGVQRVKLYPVRSCSFPTFQSAKNQQKCKHYDNEPLWRFGGKQRRPQFTQNKFTINHMVFTQTDKQVT
jgi:hypothetical protein